MKKRTLALALALGCVFMSPTLSYGEENAEVVSEIEEDSSTDEGNNNSWGKVAVVDDFGDATGQSVISTVVSGTFSNTATTGSDLLVTAYINFDEFDYCYDLSFKLLEYKDTPATYFSSDSKELKIKVGSINTVYEYGLLGEEPNGNVYVSGSGSDDGDGSPEAPAATFAKAKELLGGNAGTIYVSGTINVTGEESWTLAEGQSLARADGFTGALVSVAEGGKLTLSSITVDGREIEGVDSPLVTVAEGGSLTVEAGAVLEHNLSSKPGGAVVCNGTMTMTGGEIRGNAAASGGAVRLGGTFTMEGGSIHDNTASGTGAGIDAFKADSITLNGGSIKNNEAESKGGGIYIFFTKLNVGADASIIANKAADGAGMSVAAHAHTALAADRNRAQVPVWEFRKSESMEKSISSSPHSGKKLRHTACRGRSPHESMSGPARCGGTRLQAPLEGSETVCASSGI